MIQGRARALRNRSKPALSASVGMALKFPALQLRFNGGVRITLLYDPKQSGLAQVWQGTQRQRFDPVRQITDRFAACNMAHVHKQIHTLAAEEGDRRGAKSSLFSRCRLLLDTKPISERNAGLAARSSIASSYGNRRLNRMEHSAMMSA